MAITLFIIGNLLLIFLWRFWKAILFQLEIAKTIKNNKDEDAWATYYRAMKEIKKSCKELESIGVPREDIAMLLPLAMTTSIVDKRNLRNLIDMSRQRKCFRAYWEFRELFSNMEEALSNISDEWKWIVENQLMPKCEILGYCPEKKSCGRKQRKMR